MGDSGDDEEEVLLDLKEERLYKRESGAFKAVNSDILEILQATKQVVNKIQTDPPPSIAKKLEGVGVYRLSGVGAPVEQIRTIPFVRKPKKTD